jgi:hypothetical protein
MYDSSTCELESSGWWNKGITGNFVSSSEDAELLLSVFLPPASKIE